MSGEKLVLKGVGPNDVSIEKLFDESYGLEFKIEVGGIKLRSWYPAVLDRSQAHLLMLYLQEQLTDEVNELLHNTVKELKKIDKEYAYNEYISHSINNNSFAKEIWNAAIEKAAEVGEQDHGSYCEETGNKIRKLKV